MNDCQHERAYDNGPGFIKTCKDCLKFQLPDETRWQSKEEWMREHEEDAKNRP